MKHRKSTQEMGFTLIELVVVIAILGIVALLTIPAYVDFTSKAKDNTLKGQLGNIRGALSLSYANAAVTTGTPAFPSNVTGGLFTDLQVPSEPFTTVAVSANTVSTTAENPIATFTDQGGWIYNPTSGEVRANVSGKHSF